MNTRLSNRVLSLLLVAALLFGLASPAAAVSIQSDVTFTQVSNSAVSVNPLERADGDLNTMDEHPDFEIVRVSIILEKPSTIKAGFDTVDIAADQAAIAYRDALEREQNDLVNRIEKATGSKLDVVWNLTLATNLISANVRYGDIAAIEAVPGVKSVVLENTYLAEPVKQQEVAPNMATSGTQTGSSLAWNAGYSGAGTRIAVVDTGTDTDHQSLNATAFEYALNLIAQEKGMSYEEYVATLDLLDKDEILAVSESLNMVDYLDVDQAYFNTKLPFGFNYKDADYDITHDNDEEGEHGSHVAGIATANSWLYSEATGEYGKAMEYCFMQGVAPEAQLLTMKVFGKGGSPYDSDYFAAIEDAVVLGADVINLSLGSVAPGRGTHSNPVFQNIMDDLTDSGVVVAISAGNSGPWAETAENNVNLGGMGYLYNTEATLNTMGQPGSFTNSLAVASVENDGMIGFYISVGGEMIVYNEDNRDGQFTNKPFTSIAGEHEYIFLDAVGKAEDWAAVADVLPGKIALCSRGETNFVEKATLAIDAGAIAVFIYNNQSGVITLDLTEYLYANPVAALTQAQGAAIRAASTPVLDESGNVKYLTGTMTISDTIGMGQFDSAYYTMSDFSSWGVPGSLEMKPEITAPGGNIYSILGSTPENGNGTGGYVIMSGTSMASPQVAGMSALMAQYVRENNLVEKTGMDERHLIQSLLMSTAQPLLASEGIYWPILQQGSGMANVYDAMSAGSWITMAPGSSAGAEDGKVKVELFDDPDRNGSYTASFTVNNMTGEEKVVNLNADFFVQALFSDGEHTYLDYTTTQLPMDVIWTVNGSRVRSAAPETGDFNVDGVINTADGQALLDYATGVRSELNDKENADIDADGDIDSHDAYLFLRSLSVTTATLPAGGSVDLKVSFSLSPEVKAALNENYPNGTYIQGFLYADVEGDTTHSIPVLGFYGNWSDSSMFDIGQWSTYATGEDTRVPYIGRTRGNDFKVMYEWDRGYNYSFAGNPIIPDSKYMPERNAMNSADSMDGVSFIAIRHADQSRVTVTNETTGKTIMDQLTGAVNMAYYYGALGWQNSGMTLTTNFSLKDTAEDDLISMDFTLVPEYYIDENGEVDWEALGSGTTLSTSWTIDNTAPELFGVSIDILTNTMTVKASDNNYVAGVGLYNKTGTRVLAQTGAKQDIEKGEVAEYSFSLDKVNGKKFLLQVFDYAMNRATYLIEMQIGESTDLPPMMAFDLVSRHWAGFDKDFEYDYKVGTPRVAYSDHTFFAATIAEHYVFASTNKGELYVMPEDDLSDTTFIADLEMVLYDMAYNMADGEIYAVTETGELVYFHKLTGEVTRIGQIGINTNTLACSPEGVFYCNELGTGKVYSFTLETMDEPQLLMEDPYLKQEDPLYGDRNGTEGNMGMEYNPNTNMICWNSHIEILMGAYITFAYYYEIDPATGEFTRYADFWHEMAGLIIPVRSGADLGWADPTDEVIAVKLNKSEIDVIRGTTAQLNANVQPWTATDRTVTWTSDDETIATVDKYGVVTGISEGTTTIRATSNLDPDFYGECVVNVEILQTTLHGTLSDENGQSMFYDWDMSQENGWTAGAKLDKTMTSATWSDAENAFYMMDNISNKWEMHKVTADGTVLASAPNTNSIAFWDMAYNSYFSQVHGEEQVSAIYYYYLLSPKNPMNMNAVGFNLGDLADYLVGITSMGFEVQYDENDTAYDTEHLVLLDNDGYVWDFWIYDVPETGGMNALYNITKSNLTCEFPGDDTMDNLYTSLMAGEDGNLYLSTFNGTTNEIWHMSYDSDIRQYVAVKLGDVGANVWPATITSVTVNGSAAAKAASPAPAYTMSATEISDAELKAAASKASFSVTAEELEYKTNASGTKDDPITLVPGSNSGTAPKSGSDKYCYFTYTAASEGTVTVTSEGTDWRANYYLNGEQQNTNLINPKYDGSTITCDLAAGDTFLLMISPYKSYMYGGDITVDFAFSGEGGEVVEPTDPTEPSEPVETDPTEPSEPEANEDTLVIGANELTSGNKYTYTAAEDGRLEFDFVITDAEVKQIYQYAYSKGTRVKIFVNDTYVPNVEDTKVTVSKGQTVTVELQSVDGGEYTATLTLTALEPASKLVIGDNNIATKTDYSFIADRDGKLYTTIKELWCDSAYCSSASLSSSVVFRINGATVYGFENSYEVKAGDEITVLMNTQFGEPANAVLNLSWDGFYKHPFGTRGNPAVVTYAEMPTSTVEIPAGTAYWFKFTGFPASAEIHMMGADGAYIIYSGQNIPVPAGKSINFNSVRSLQIGNSGSEDASFELYYTLIEGSIDNPRDLVEGKNTVTIDESDNFFYDFVAEENGTATFTVSGDDWRFFYSLMGADGTALVDNEDHQAKRGDAATVTVDMTAGQSIVVKLGTLNASWTAPGGTLTVDFHFEPEAVEPEPTDPEPSEPEVPENPLALGKNDLTTGVEYSYVVPADGRMEFSVGSVYNSAGSKQYSWWGGTKLNILIDGKPMTASAAKRNVTAGQVITVMIESLDGDTYTADMTLKEIAAAETLTLGQNALQQNLEYVYTAEKNGTLYFSVVEMLYNGSPVNESVLGNSVQMTINGASVSSFNKSYEVKTGDELAVVIKDYSWDGSGVVNTTVNLSFEGFFEHPTGSLVNPVKLMLADCPTDSIEIAAGSAAWYELESYYDESAWSDVYPFDGKYLIVTGENAFVDVDGTIYNAGNGIVRVLMDEQTLIQIGNAGSAPAVFGISVEIPEGTKDNPQDLIEGENKVTLPSYGSHYYDFHATKDGTVTVTVSGENWKYTFAHCDANGEKLSGKDYYAKNDDTNTVTLEIKAGESIIVTVGTSKGYSQPGGLITVNFHFESAEPECQHTNTTTSVENEIPATCTTDGSYETVTTCADCGEELKREKTVVPALGHDYQDGVCGNCGQADPNAPDNTVIVEVTNDVDATNGVFTLTWDPAKLTLTDITVHADYRSILKGEGQTTFGYVSLFGIPAGKAVATLTFEAVDPADAVVTIECKQLNNEADETPHEHAFGEWTVTTPATCTEKGVETRTCECGETETREIAALGHNYEDGVCTECGHKLNPFVDVPADSFYIDPVLWAVEKGITNGMDATHFGPTVDCNRAQVVTFLWRAAGSPKATKTEHPFTDVDDSAFYFDAMLWAVEKGITNGLTATTFGPDAKCSRAQIVTFLWRAEGSPAASGEHPFTDVEAGSYYEQAVLWAVEKGITNGMDEVTFGVNTICNRAQIVTFLHRTYA